MAKRSTQNMHPLDIRRIHRAGLLHPGRAFGWEWTCGGNRVADINLQVGINEVILSYLAWDPSQNWQDMNYPVRLTWTPCNFGGQRPWWRCPVSGCGRRVAVLFGGNVYACRHCQKVQYQSTRETPADQALRRAEKLRKRLGWVAGIANDLGAKPKGMHRKTFARLQALHDANTLQALTGWRRSR
jgi:hypothetical protein